MRLIFLSLLVLNLAYMGWGLWQQKMQKGIESKQSLPPLKGEKLVLLSESDELGSSLVERLPERVKPKSLESCAKVGPFRDRAEGQSFIDLLEGEGLKSSIGRVELARETQFWVVLPPANNRNEAMKSLRVLQSNKVDSYLISSGEMRNAISIGLFNQEQAAKTMQGKVKEAGFDAEIRAKDSVDNEYWVQIFPGQTLEKLQNMLSEVVKDNKNIKISKASCETFAQTK